MHPEPLTIENAVLGSIMLDGPSILAQCLAAGLEDDWFGDATAKTVWKAVSELHAAGLCADQALVFEALERGGMARTAAIQAMLDMADLRCPTSLTVGDYLTILGQRRAERARERLWAAGKEAGTIHAAADERQAAGAISATFDDTIRRPQTIQEAAKKIMDELQSGGLRDIGLPTDLIDFDRNLGKLQPTELTIVAARPGCGKSSLLRQIAVKTALAGRNVCLVSTEQSAREIVIAGARQASGVAFGPGKIPTDLQAAFTKSIQAISSCPALRLVEARQLDAILAQFAALRSDPERSPDLYIFDYVQQLDPGDMPGENMATRIGRITAALKRLAMETNTPVLAAAQLNRESATGIEPQLHHLRDSGAIEQDADRVIMLQVAEETPSEDRFAQIVVFQRKNRNGPVGDITLSFDRWTTKFSNAMV